MLLWPGVLFSCSWGPCAVGTKATRPNEAQMGCKSLECVCWFLVPQVDGWRKAAGFCQDNVLSLGGAEKGRDLPLPLAGSVLLWAGGWGALGRLLPIPVPKRGIACWVNRVRRDMERRPGTRQWARDVRNHTPPTTPMSILGSDRQQSRHGSVLRQCEAITPDLSTLSSRRASTQRVVSGDGNVQAAP